MGTANKLETKTKSATINRMLRLKTIDRPELLLSTYESFFDRHGHYSLVEFDKSRTSFTITEKKNKQHSGKYHLFSPCCGCK